EKTHFHSYFSGRSNQGQRNTSPYQEVKRDVHGATLPRFRKLFLECMHVLHEYENAFNNNKHVTTGQDTTPQKQNKLEHPRALYSTKLCFLSFLFPLYFYFTFYFTFYFIYNIPLFLQINLPFFLQILNPRTLPPKGTSRKKRRSRAGLSLFYFLFSLNNHIVEYSKGWGWPLVNPPNRL
ncbi:MAG: hypothetical protein GY714_29105, partial [Desulfobacterales bacterium]|nr:hypothetical protein [Desulfobacterales bacterium]